MKRIKEQGHYTLYHINQLHLDIHRTKFCSDWLFHLGTRTRNVTCPKKLVIGIKNLFSDEALFCLSLCSISTISSLYIALSLLYHTAKIGELRRSQFINISSNIASVGKSLIGRMPSKVHAKDKRFGASSRNRVSG